MAAFQIVSPLRPYFTQTGEIAAGGYLAFYEAGTATPTDTFGDLALTVNNGVTVTLDAAGFPNAEIWGDAALSFKVRLYDTDDVLIDEQDNVSADGDIFPSGTDGQFLGLAAGVPTFQTIRQVPDPTGHASKYLTNDGTTISWVEPAEDAETEDVQTVVAVASTTIDWSLGRVVQLTHGTNITGLTFSGLPAAGEAMVGVIRRTKDASGTTRTIDWASSNVPLEWEGGSAPTLTQTTGCVDVFSILFIGSASGTASYLLDVG